MNLGIEKAILIKKESVSGTYTAPADTDLVHYSGEPSINLEITTYDRGLKWNSLTKLPGIIGKRKATVTFDMEINPQLFDDTNYMGVLTAILQACAFEQTYNANSPVQYTEVLGEGAIMLANSVSIRYLEGGQEYQLAGARGTVKISGKVGEPMILSASLTGKIVSINSVSIDYTNFTYMETNPDIVIGGGLNLGLSNAGASAFELDLGNKLQDVSDIGENFGIGAEIITERAPVFKVDPAEDDDTFDELITAFNNQNNQSLSYKTSGTDKFIEISLNSKIQPFTSKTREGIIVFDLSYAITALTLTLQVSGA